jgi:hypothetical protein
MPRCCRCLISVVGLSVSASSFLCACCFLLHVDCSSILMNSNRYRTAIVESAAVALAAFFIVDTWSSILPPVAFAVAV